MLLCKRKFAVHFFGEEFKVESWGISFKIVFWWTHFYIVHSLLYVAFKDIKLHWITILSWYNNTKVYVCDSISLMVQCTFYWYFGFRKVFYLTPISAFSFKKAHTFIMASRWVDLRKKWFPFSLFYNIFLPILQ